jgi:calcium-dependent protein kinase
LLQKDPNKRLSAEEALNDPWVQTYSEKSEVDLPTLAKSLNNL